MIAREYEATIYAIVEEDEEGEWTVEAVSYPPLILNIDRDFEIEKLNEKNVKCKFKGSFTNTWNQEVTLNADVKTVFMDERIESGSMDLMDEFDVDDIISEFFDEIVDEIETKLTTGNIPFDLFEWEIKEIKEYFMPGLVNERNEALKAEMDNINGIS